MCGIIYAGWAMIYTAWLDCTIVGWLIMNFTTTTLVEPGHKLQATVGGWQWFTMGDTRQSALQVEGTSVKEAWLVSTFSWLDQLVILTLINFQFSWQKIPPSVDHSQNDGNVQQWWEEWRWISGTENKIWLWNQPLDMMISIRHH